MEKRTLLSVVIAVILGIGAYAALRAPEKGERKTAPARPIPVFKAAEITGIETTTPAGDHTKLEKRGDKWMVVEPSEWPADSQSMKTLLDGIERMTIGDIVTEQAAKHADLGVLDGKAVHLKITAGANTADILLGQNVGGFTMLRVVGKNEVWQSDKLFSFNANKTAKDWRDHAIISGAAADFDSLVVETPSGGNRIELARSAPEPGQPNPDAAKKAAQWKLVSSSGDAPKAGDVLDTSQPTTVGNAMVALRAIGFADGKTLKETGLEPPSLKITVGAKDVKQELEIGSTQGDEVFVHKAGAPTIYIVKKYLLDRVMFRPIDYRDKTLLHYKADEIAALHVTQGKDETTLTSKNGAWTLTGGPLDKTKAIALVGGVDSLVGSAFLTDKTVKSGLDKPRATVRLDLKNGKKVTLKVGALSTDQSDYYVMVDGSKDVLLAKKFAIDRLLKKPADLAPAPPSAKGSPGGPHGMPPGMMPH